MTQLPFRTPQSTQIVAPRRPAAVETVRRAPAQSRPGLAALLALDERLGDVLRAASQPPVALLKLGWWHEALSGIAAGTPPPAEPLLTALAPLPFEVRGGLHLMVEGWEALLDDPLDASALRTHAERRGGTLFAAAAMLLGEEDPARARAAGARWALLDVRANVAGDGTQRLCLELSGARTGRLPGGLAALRPLIGAVEELSPLGRALQGLLHR